MQRRSTRACKIVDCARTVVAWDMCDPHYRRWRKGQQMELAERRTTCDIDGCSNKHCARGYCSKHYEAWRSHGDPLFERPMIYTKCVRQRCSTEPTVGADLCNRHLMLLAQKNAPRTCSIQACSNKHYANGYCEPHNWRHTHGSQMETPLRVLGADKGECSHNPCARPADVSGLCQLHYNRRARGIDMDLPVKTRYENPTCKHSGCRRDRDGSLGFCSVHYDRYRRGREMDSPIRSYRPGRTCSIEGCSEPYVAQGYCSRHYFSITGKGAEYCRKRRAVRRGGIPFSREAWKQKCAYWGNKCWMCGSSSQDLEADHVKPVSKGGLDALANLRPACRSCNASKNAQWPLPDGWLHVGAYPRAGCSVGA